MGMTRGGGEEQFREVENDVASGMQEKGKRNNCAGTGGGGSVGGGGNVGLDAVEKSGVDAGVTMGFVKKSRQFVDGRVGRFAWAAVGKEEQGRWFVGGEGRDGWWVRD